MPSIEEMLNEIIVYKCPVCAENTATKPLMKMHMNRAHKGAIERLYYSQKLEQYGIKSRALQARFSKSILSSIQDIKDDRLQEIVIHAMNGAIQEFENKRVTPKQLLRLSEQTKYLAEKTGKLK